MYKIIGTVLLFVSTVSIVIAAGNNEQKIRVCHVTGNGSAQIMTVSGTALSAHLQHGDVFPGDMVPGTEEGVYSDDCEVIEVPETGPVITPGVTTFTSAAGVGWYGESLSAEILIGVPDVMVGTNRNENEKNWNDNGLHRITFNWDKGANAISTTVDGSALVYDFKTAEVFPTCDPDNWNIMSIAIIDDVSGGVTPNIMLRNVTLGGFPLGELSHSGQMPTMQEWALSNFDFSESFTFSADIDIEGDWVNGANTYIAATVGCT